MGAPIKLASVPGGCQADGSFVRTAIAVNVRLWGTESRMWGVNSSAHKCQPSLGSWRSKTVGPSQGRRRRKAWRGAALQRQGVAHQPAPDHARAQHVIVVPLGAQLTNVAAGRAVRGRHGRPGVKPARRGRTAGRQQAHAELGRPKRAGRVWLGNGRAGAPPAPTARPAAAAQAHDAAASANKAEPARSRKRVTGRRGWLWHGVG